MFVAIVYNADQGFTSRRDDGDYSCFLGATEEEAVEKAMTAKRKWDGYKHSDGSITYYRVVVGEATKVVKVKDYELKDFTGEFGWEND